MRGSVAIAASLLTALLAGPASAAPLDAPGLCAALSIPEELGLACEPSATVPGGAVVRPRSGEFAVLSSLGVRELDRGADAAAWDDPDAWLRGRLTVDTEAVAGSLRDLTQSPDSPLAGEAARDAVGSILGLLDGLGRLPLSACEPIARREPGIAELRCRLTARGIGGHRVERLQSVGERRFALSWQTANEQRLRHFEALANGFRPG